jgi:endoglucanase
MGADANLWVKLPGESDGECGAYPNLRAGAFSPIIASNLIKGI